MADDVVVENVTLVTVDHYVDDPIDGLDSLYSEFWGTSVVKVPVLRVFGSTQEGKYWISIFYIVFVSTRFHIP